jgi:hypothetical protein
MVSRSQSPFSSDGAEAWAACGRAEPSCARWRGLRAKEFCAHRRFECRRRLPCHFSSSGPEIIFAGERLVCDRIQKKHDVHRCRPLARIIHEFVTKPRRCHARSTARRIMSATFVDAGESVSRQCLACGAWGLTPFPASACLQAGAWCLSLSEPGQAPSRTTEPIPKQSVDRPSSEPARLAALQAQPTLSQWHIGGCSRSHRE